MKKRVLIFCVLTGFFCLQSSAQNIPQQDQINEKPPVRITGIQPSLATSGDSKWTKILVNFAVDPSWIDGMQISVAALVGDGTKERPFSVLTGMVTYINVPQGLNAGVLFISPNTTKRYGNVAAVDADIYLNDRVVSSLNWSAGGKKPPANWQGVFDRREGGLLPITSTPWFVTEFDRYPDMVGGR
jgi:hypothetical protein